MSPINIKSYASSKLYEALSPPTIEKMFKPCDRNKTDSGGWRMGTGGPGYNMDQWWVGHICSDTTGPDDLREVIYTLPRWIGNILSVIKIKPHRAVTADSPWRLLKSYRGPVIAAPTMLDQEDMFPASKHLGPMVGGWRLGFGMGPLKDDIGNVPRGIEPHAWWLGVVTGVDGKTREAVYHIPDWASIFIEEMVQQEVNWFRDCNAELERDMEAKQPLRVDDGPPKFEDIEWDATEPATGLVRRQADGEWVFQCVETSPDGSKWTQAFVVPETMKHALNGLSIVVRQEGWGSGQAAGKEQAYDRIIKKLIRELTQR